MTAAVTLKGISKSYRTYSSRRDRLKDLLGLDKGKAGRDFWALDNVDLTVQPGTTLGILGRNGAGKSTLLSIISGVLKPTSGTREVNGRLAALLQLGAGFNAEFTGRENVMMNGLILGIDRREMIQRFDEIAEFADIGEFMERPVKTYSSGMRARLGFAVAVSIEPDILVVDETLSVGDAVFKHAGLRRMRELRDSGTTIMFVSHSMGMVRDFCSEGVLLHEGRLLFQGETGETIDRYQALISQTKAQKKRSDRPDGDMGYEIEEEDDFDPDEGPASWGGSTGAPRLRHGTREARILGVDLLDETGERVEEVGQESRVTIRVRLEYTEDVDGSTVGIALRNKAGIEVFSTDTKREGTRLGPRQEGERVAVDFTVETPLKKGTYDVAAYVSQAGGQGVYMDWVDLSAIFKVSRRQGVKDIPGLVHLPTSVEVHDGGKTQRPSKSA